jgi:formylglycine-generating enzyme required for sulfatase activity
MTTEALAELTERVLGQAGAGGDRGAALVLADAAIERGEPALLAAALDRAWGLDPTDARVAALRAQALDALALREHGLVFRYVPEGSFLMGSEHGDLDERPVHPERTAGFWLTEVPVSWADACRLLDWEPPPAGHPRTLEGGFSLNLENRIRLQYCETQTLRAVDWHSHAGLELTGPVPRRDPTAPDAWGDKPMVAVAWQVAAELGALLSTPGVTYGLPTEAEWERAARGGLIGKRYSWGDEPPSEARCDFGHFGTFVIRPPRELPPNGYGLFGTCGGVWEWTADPYDALRYHPRRPQTSFAEEAPRVLRGGSFVDEEAAVTVSFRMALTSEHFRAERDGGWRRNEQLTPTVGFRLVRRGPPRGAPGVASRPP